MNRVSGCRARQASEVTSAKGKGQARAEDRSEYAQVANHSLKAAPNGVARERWDEEEREPAQQESSAAGSSEFPKVQISSRHASLAAMVNCAAYVPESRAFAGKLPERCMRTCRLVLLYSSLM
ncbi:hypothetical protein Ciccas_000462 [Cichlidogyrus casuarinus]|uniref:Uncharacterized protein n=1 Tax=Cichlidogyrus casuarinus TaxID=1844966 RepID=A0ABD2QMU7_9PLAT